MLVASLFAIAVIPHAHAAPASGERLITIHDRGNETGFITSATTLRNAFSEQHILLDKNDLVEPGLDDQLVGNNYEVNIYRARPVVIVDGATKQLVMTAYQTPKQIAAQAGIVLHDEDSAQLELTNNLLADGASERMVVDRATAVKLVLYGKDDTVYTQTTSVSDFLKEKSITLAKGDTLSVHSQAAITPNMRIEIWHNGKQTVTREESIEAPLREIRDADQPIGYQKVKAAGVAGKKLVTYEIVMKNGREISRKATHTVVVKKPTERVVVVGAKYAGSLGKWLYELRMCETGGNYQTNTGNGYYGAYQFSISTWNSLNTGYARADQAPASVQDKAIIANTIRSGGGLATQNPGCYASRGLSQFPPEQ